MDLNDYYNLDVRNEQTQEQLFKFIIELLDSLINQEDYSEQDIYFLPAVFDRANGYLQYHHFSCDSFSKHLNEIEVSINKLIHSRPNYSDAKRDFKEQLRSLYRSAIKCSQHLRLSVDSRYFYDEFHLIYNPELSAKEQAIKFLREAIKCIDAELHLTDRSKSKIKQQIEKIIQLLGQEHTDWIQYFGYLGRTITLLGALGSAIGGGVGLYSLHKAQEAMNQANIVIQKTSINYSFNQFNQYHNQIYVSEIEFKNNKINPGSDDPYLQIPSIIDADLNVVKENKLGLPPPKQTTDDNK